MKTRTLRLAIVGFGNVGRCFARGVLGPYRRALDDAGLRIVVTGIATGRHGLVVEARGLDLARVLRLLASGRSLAELQRGRGPRSAMELVATAPADVLIELTPLDPNRGEPATTHVRTALRRGLHVVTANKGPVAFARRGLVRLAERRGRLFLHEGAVMDGTPVFSFFERCLPGVRVLSFRGTLNGTTGVVLTRMEDGLSREEAVREAQALGIAEADPAHDLEGWDAAFKGAALARALWDVAVDPRRVPRRGIGGITPEEIRSARRLGAGLRLVVRGERVGRGARVAVAPEPVPAGDPLAGRGGDAVLLLKTDLVGEIGVVERTGTIEQTAYAVLSDLLTIAGRTPNARPAGSSRRRSRVRGRRA